MSSPTAPAADTTSYDVIPIDDIATHPKNPRRDVGDITELADSIVSKGLLEPLVVAPWPLDIPWKSRKPKPSRVLIAGHRRLAAARHAGLPALGAITRTDLATSAAQIEAMLIENLQRADLTPVEEADAYQALLDLDIPDQTIADHTGMPIRRVRERLKLTKLPPAAQTKLHAGQTTITDALAMLEFEDDAATTKNLAGKLGTDRFRFELEAARRDKNEAAKYAATRAAVEKAGITIRKSAPDGAKKIARERFAGRGELELIPHTVGWDSDKQTQWVLKNHKGCPGALAVEQKQAYSKRLELVHYCTQPKLHPRPKVVRTEAELDKIAREKAEKQRTLDQIAIAENLRHEWIRDAHLTPVDAAALLVDVILADPGYVAPLDHYRALLSVCQITPPEPSPGNRNVHVDQVHALLRPALQRKDIVELALLAAVQANTSGESSLTAPWGWVRNRGRAWLELLQHHGYAPTEWETARYLTEQTDGDAALEDDVDPGAS